MVALTPYGQSVCVNELKLRKRDRFTQRSGSDLQNLQSKESPLLPSIVSVTTPTTHHSRLTLPPTHTQQLDLSNVKDVESELEKRELQIRDQGQKLEYLSQQLERKEMENNELRNWIDQCKLRFALPAGYQPPHDSLINAEMIQNNNQLAQQIYQNSANVHQAQHHM